MMNRTLSRIPFHVGEERLIERLSHRMRALAVVTLMIGILVLFLALVVLLSLLAAVTADKYVIGQRFYWMVLDHRFAVGGVAVASLLGGLLVAYAGYSLLRAALDFGNVSRTAEADEDFLARGLEWLNTFFKIVLVLAILSIFAGFASRASLGFGRYAAAFLSRFI